MKNSSMKKKEVLSNAIKTLQERMKSQIEEFNKEKEENALKTNNAKTVLIYDFRKFRID